MIKLCESCVLCVQLLEPLNPPAKHIIIPFLALITFSISITHRQSQERFYNSRSINSAAFCVIRQMSKKLLGTQIINPFLNSMISANHEKEEEFKPMQW